MSHIILRWSLMWISVRRPSLFQSLPTSRKYLEGIELTIVGLSKFLSALGLLISSLAAKTKLKKRQSSGINQKWELLFGQQCILN